MKRRLFLTACLATLAGLPASAQTAHDWVMATEYPATSIVGEGLEAFAAAVTRRLEGRVVVKAAFGPKDARSADMPMSVASGRWQGGDAFGGAIGAVNPVFGLSSLPFVATSLEEARRLAVAARPLYEKALADKGLRLLYLTPWPPSGVWSRKPITGAANLSGLTIRTYDAPSTQVFAAAGAVASNLSFADVMGKLRDGSVDAVLSSGDGGAGRRLWEFLPHFTPVNYAVPLSFTFVSTAVYDALPPADRAAIDAVGRETEQRQWSALVGRLEQNYAQMKANGVVIGDVRVDVVEALQRASTPVIAEWSRLSGPDAAGILQSYIAGKRP